MKKKTRNVLIIGLALVAVVVLALTLGGGSTGSAQSEDIAKVGDISTYYAFSGNVEVENSQRISATTQATVREVYVSKHDTVKKQDRILRLSTGETIKATTAGEVSILNIEKDDEVNPGDLLAEIIDYDNLLIQVKVDEFDTHAIAPGTEVTVTINALERTFTSTVDEVSKQPVTVGDISYYMATIVPPEDMTGVLPGMQVDVRVQNEQADNAVLVPMRALLFDDYGAPYVQVKDARGNAQKTPVQIGINDGVQVQILSGVSSGDTLLISGAQQGMESALMNRVRGE